MEKCDKIVFVLGIPKNRAKDLTMIDRLNDPSVPYDIVYLTDDPTIKKVLIKHMTIDKEALAEYKFVVPVGAEPFTKLLKLSGGVTRFAGTLVTDPMMAVPITSPGILFVNPAMADSVNEQFEFISKMYHNNCDLGVKNTKHYEHIDNIPRYLELMEKLKDKPLLVCDLETSAFDPEEGEILQVVLTDKIHYGYSINYSIIEHEPAPLKGILEHTKVVFHNAKFDCKWLKHKLDIIVNDFEDTMLVHYCFINQNKGTHGLKMLSMEYTDLGDYDRELDDWKKTYCRRNKVKVADFTYDMIPSEILAPYACGDVDATMQLWENMAIPAIENAHPDTVRCYEEILKPASNMLMEVEMSGAPIDIDEVDVLDRNYAKSIAAVQNGISAIPEAAKLEQDQGSRFNPNSFQQIGKLLFQYMKLPVQGKTATGNPSTDADTLKALEDMSPVPGFILKLRKLMKMRNTYVVNIKGLAAANGRLRGSFNLQATTSGRLSSSMGDD